MSLHPSTSASVYEFEIETPAGKQIGDPVEDRTAIFTLRSNTSISHATSLSGYIEYVPTEEEELVKPWDGVAAYGAYTIKSYFVQNGNDDTRHLNCLNRLKGSFTNINLTNSSTAVVLRPQLGVFKVIVDGFLYPIYSGSVAYLKGFKNASNDHDANLVMTLGVRDFEVTKIDKYVESISGTPLIDVSSDIDPITNYAVNDGRTFTFYVPFTTERTLKAGHILSVTLVDEWSNDAYVWNMTPRMNMDFKPGNVYTIDMTKYGDPDVYILIDQSKIGYLFTRNMGASKPDEVGNYYLFGHSDHVKPGEHYPQYPSNTNYLYYNYSNNKDCLIFGSSGGSSGNGLVATYTFTYSSNAMLSSVTDPSGLYCTTTVLWTKGFGNEFTRYLKDCAATITVPSHLKTADFEGRVAYEIEHVDCFGNVTEDSSQAVGVRMIATRTRHKVYLPISELLGPSIIDEQTSKGIIPPAAIAQSWSPDTKRAYFITEYFHMFNISHGEDKGVDQTMNAFNVETGTSERIYVPFYVAYPVRPALKFSDNRYGIKALVPGITL